MRALTEKNRQAHRTVSARGAIILRALADKKPPVDIELNGVDRFRKNSPRVLFEAYSHCEVPAGCGGAVLRHSDITVSVPMTLMMVFVCPTATVWLDGANTDGQSWLDITAGRHRLSIALAAAPSTNYLLANMGYDLRKERYVSGPREALKTLRLATAPRFRWKVTAETPPNDWLSTQQTLGSNWRDPDYFSLTSVKQRKYDGYTFAQLAATDARPLGIRDHLGPLWIHCDFVLNLAEELALR